MSASAAKKPLSLQTKNRTLLIFATSIVGFHILQEVFFGQTAFGSFVSNLLQVLCAVVATIACARAVRRGRGFTRPFWILIGLSFVIWIAADLGWMYYESYLGISPPRDSIFHFFVDLRSLFLAMALLLDQDDEERPYYLDAGSLLDGVQLFIIFSLLYLGWYHIFSLHENRVLSVLRSDQIEVSENFAVLALAALQAMRAHTRELKNLYLGFLGCFGLLALTTSFTDYRELRMGREISTGSWADLGSTIPFLLIAWWARGWKQRPDFYPSYGKKQNLPGMFFENTIYCAGPLIIVLQAFELGPTWKKLSLPLLGISILCFGLRLTLSKFRETEAASQLREVNDSLRNSEARLREFERVVEGLDEMITVVDRDYRYLLANQAFLKYRKMTTEEVIGREVRDVLNPEAFDSVVKSKLDECFKGKVVQYEMRYDYPERGNRDLAISYFPISGAQGVDRAACILEDITERKRSEQALRESEDRYRDLVEHSEDLVCTHDLQGNLLSVNPAPARVLGYEVDELLRTPMRDLLAPESRERFDAYLETIKTEGAAKGFIWVLAKSGERRIWEYSNSLRTEGVCSPVVRGLAHDVTDRKKAEEALLESEGRMRLFVEHSPAAVALFDREMRYIQASKRWVNDYGLGDRELHGLSHYEVFSEIPEEWKKAHRRGLAGEVLQEDGDRFERADGTVQFLRWQIHPWREANGQIGGIAIFTEDITARKHAETALRSSEQRYRMLFEKNIAGVAISDADGVVLGCNDAWAQMLGYDSAEEIRGRHASEFYFDIKDRAQLLEEMKRQGAFCSQEMQLRRREGSSVWVLFNSVVRTAEDGSLIRQATATDVTERKRAELELQRSEQRLKLALQAGRIGAFEADIETGRGIWTPELANIWGTAASIDANMVGYCWDHTHPKDHARITAEFSRIAETGEQGQMEFRILRPNGEQRWIRWFGRVIQGPDASRRAIGVNIDVTKEKEADEALRRSEERFRVALQKSPISVFNQDRDLRYTWIYNPHLHWEHDVIGKTDEEILGPKKTGVLSELKKQVLKTGVAVREDVALPQNGRRYVFDMTIEPLFDEKQEIVGITGASIDIARLRELADQLQESAERLAREKSYLESQIQTELGFEEIIGQSGCLHEVLRKARVVAPTHSTVLLLGETGTGKELVARSVHGLSTRRENTFVKLNCAAVPSGLLESELFGHERGAFTGAVSQKVGRIELAHKGTLFLDEIGEMPLDLQPKLLRVLQDREFERLGGVKTLRVDVRIIAATNRDLRQDVIDKRFREDLFYRLNVFPIELPPLRNRKEDIPSLVYHFVHKHTSKMGKHIDEVPSEVMRILCKWNWPGNIRELENMIERMVIMTKGKTLAAPPAEIQHEEDYAEDDLVEIEREHIIRILRQTRGVLSGPEGAASRLGLKRTTLQSMMKRLGIEPSEYRGWGNGTFGKD